MHRKKQTFSFIACLVVLLFTGCGPGPGVYEGPLRWKTSAELKEGNEYLVFFEDDETKASITDRGTKGAIAVEILNASGDQVTDFGSATILWEVDESPSTRSVSNFPRASAVIAIDLR